MKFTRNLLFWALFFTPLLGFSKSIFFSHDAGSFAGCEDGGTQKNPWPSVTDAVEAGCVVPGDELVILPGVYGVNRAQLFRKNKIVLKGEEGAPITVRGLRGNNSQWPVKLFGNHTIRSEYLILEGLEFIRSKDGEDILSVGESYHVRIRHSLVHGDRKDYIKAFQSGNAGDCIKIAGGDKRVEYITIENSKIYNCPQDAIDVTGRKNISYLDNEIYNSRLMQIKGGSENILLEGNYIHNMYYGVLGRGMDCTKDGILKGGKSGYCGSPSLPDMPVENRFQANNVTIRNNRFENIRRQAIEASGWRKAVIESNTFTGTALDEGGYQIVFHEGVTTAFFDDEALLYCEKNPQECKPCLSFSGRCVKIRLRADQIRITDNQFNLLPDSDQSDMRILSLEEGAVKEISSVCVDNNSFASSAPETYRVIGAEGKATVANADGIKKLGICAKNRPVPPDINSVQLEQ